MDRRPLFLIFNQRVPSSNPVLITDLADFPVREVDLEHVF